MGDREHLEDELMGDDGSGDETDVEDNVTESNVPVLFPSQRQLRTGDPDLPETVEVLTTRKGCKVYLVGTAHFSESSQHDVIKTIEQTQPDFVVLELCASRISILSLDEETLLREAKSINIQKVQAAIQQSGLLQGILHVLLLSLSARLTEQLGMAPGGEFRAALKEAQKIPGCRVRLGDRPIGVTLRRALHALSWFQKLSLAFHVITCRDSVSKEDVERCKQKDLLEEMLLEMTGEFPELSQVFVAERDMYLAQTIRGAAIPLCDVTSDQGLPSLIALSSVGTKFIPSVTVGVVGIGHVPGIVANWEKDIDMKELLVIPKPTASSIMLKWVFRASITSAVAWGCYKAFKLTYSLINSYR